MSELMEKVAEVAPDIFLFLENAAHEIKQGPFLNETVAEMDHIIKTAESYVEKTALSLGGIGKGLMHAGSEMAANPAARYVGATIAGGVALSLAGDLYEAARRGLTKSRHWSAMLEMNPDLAARSKSDPAVKTMFDTLHRFNPEFASDPHVAANFVNAQLEFPSDVGIVQGLVKSRNDIRNATGLRTFNMPQPKSKADLEEQQLRMHGQKAQTGKNLADVDKIHKELAGDPQAEALERAMRESQIENQRAQSFKNRQEAMQAYNQRMGMGSAEQMEQLRRRNRK